VTDQPPGTADPKPHYKRRLSDKILIAFHHACDQRDIEVAEHLLGVLEFMSKRTRGHAGRERRFEDSLIAAHERLWLLRHSADDTLPAPGRGVI
jgi:hypothetical protein